MSARKTLSWALAGTAVGAILAGLSAGAASAKTAAQPAPDADAAGSQANVVGEVIVTANKRAEKLHDVPAAVDVITSDVMQKTQITDPKDFSQLAPTLQFEGADEARLFNFSVRGIGTEVFSVGVETSVATIVDGVVYTRPGAAFDGLTDLERVEVLSGPQGTLQGKNASAGAVSIVTKNPNRTHWEKTFESTIAQQNENRETLMVSGPLTDKLAMRAYGWYGSRDGVVTNIANGQTMNNVTTYGFRGKLDWRPTDWASFLLSGDFAHRDSPCCAEPIRVGAPSGNVTAGFTGTPVGPDNRYVNFDTNMVGIQKNDGLSLQGDFRLPAGFTLTSLTAYRHYSDWAIRDRDGTQAPFTGVTAQQLYESTHPGITEAQAETLLSQLMVNPLSFAMHDGKIGESNDLEQNGTFSQEIRLASPVGEKLDYMVGLYFYDAIVKRQVTIAGVRSNIPGNVVFNGDTATVVNPNAYVLADDVDRVRSKNEAIFGNVNWRPIDKLTLTGGFRYLADQMYWHHHKVTGPNGDHIGPVDPSRPGANFGTPALNTIGNFSDNALIGKVSAKYAFTPDLLVYASYAEGFKGVAVDADLFIATSETQKPAAPERSKSYETGFRGRFWDRRAELNVTLYDTTFYNYQTTSSGLDGSGAPVLQSAGQLFTKGVEGNFSIRPVGGLRIGGDFLFASNKFGDLYVDPAHNVKGGQPLDAPASKYGLQASYDTVVHDYKVSFNTNYTWTDKTLFTNLADAINPGSPWWRPAYGVANASVTVRDPDNRYRVTAFVKNLADEHYADGFRRISGSVGGAGAVAQSLPRDFDRYFGATLSVSF